MPERVSVNQLAQFGLESPSGTGVAANKAFSSFAVIGEPDEDTREYTPQGAGYPMNAQEATENVKADITGWPDYVSDVYLWSSLMGAATITSVGIGTKKWAWTDDGFTVPVPKTFTVELGSSVRAHKFTYGTVPDLGWSWKKKKSLDLAGRMIGLPLADGITLTATPTRVASVPVHPQDLKVWIDPTSGALGTTELVRLISADFKVEGRYTGIFPAARGTSGFTVLVARKPKTSIKLRLEADVAGMAQLTAMRGGITQFIRLEHQGALIPGESSFSYLYQTDAAVKVMKVGKVAEDDDGLSVVDVEMQIAVDPAWGFSWKHTMQNQLAAL
jgi:hypothetical protein